MASLSPVSVVALRPLVCGAVTWRSLGVLRVTVIVKATFGLVNGGDARLVAPQALTLKDRPRGGRADASLEHASDLAPYLPNASFTVNGTAHAPGNTPTPQMSASIAIHRERPVLEKTIYVYGDRRDGATKPLPFSSMPIVYERTYGGAGVAENPVGVGAAPGDRAPNLVDPNDPRGPAGFGPIASTWAPRARMVLPKDRERLESDPMELPSTVDFRLFSAAPADQHLPYLRGDEWITLDGMHATHARLSTRLPSVTAAARWSIPSRGSPATHLELVADTLHLDVDRQTGHVVWRGHFVIESLDVLPLLHVEAAVEMPGYTAPWPAVVHDEATAALDTADVVELPAIAGPATEDEGTSIIELPGGSAPLPFAPGLAAPAIAQAAASSHLRPEVPVLRDTSSEVISPFARIGGPALPFASPGAAPAPGDSPSPGATVTNQISPFARPVMPFASSAPSSARAARPVAPIPGAPWSGEQPTRAPAVQSDEGSTMLINLASLREPTLEGEGAAAVTPPPALPFAAPASPLSAPPLVAAMPFVTAPPVMRSAPPLMPSAPPLMPSASPLMPSAPPLMPSAPPLMPSAPPLVAAPPATVSAPPRADPPPMPPALLGEPKAPAEAVAPRRAQPEPEPETEDAPDPGDVTPFAAVRAELVARVRASRSAADLALAGANLSTLDLKGADLKGANLAGATLVRANLDGAVLSGANLSGANLAGASLKGADLERADFSRATLSGARLEGARVAGAMFGEAKGTRANFKGAKGARPNLSKGTWDRAVFSEVELFGADFGGSSLVNADFSGAALEGVRFDDARARGATFDGARAGQMRANGADFEGASFDHVEAAGSLWERANVGKACFRGAALRGATLARATADAAIFDGADLEGASFQRATAHGASFAGAKLDGADLRQARATDAVFEGAKLKRATGAKAELGGSRFDKAELDGANLREAKLKKASFLGAKLDGADLRDTELDGADLRGASQKGTKLAGATKVGALEGDAPAG